MVFERKGEYRRLLCLVADDSHGERISRSLFGATRRTIHEGRFEIPQAAGVEEARQRLGSTYHHQDGISRAAPDRGGGEDHQSPVLAI